MKKHASTIVIILLLAVATYKAINSSRDKATIENLNKKEKQLSNEIESLMSAYSVFEDSVHTLLKADTLAKAEKARLMYRVDSIDKSINNITKFYEKRRNDIINSSDSEYQKYITDRLNTLPPIN